MQAFPQSSLAFHWPRLDRDQLLCIRYNEFVLPFSIGYPSAKPKKGVVAPNMFYVKGIPDFKNHTHVMLSRRDLKLLEIEEHFFWFRLIDHACDPRGPQRKVSTGSHTSTCSDDVSNWSGGFEIEKVDSFHVTVRHLNGRFTFVRVEIRYEEDYLLLYAFLSEFLIFLLLKHDRSNILHCFNRRRKLSPSVSN